MTMLDRRRGEWSALSALERFEMQYIPEPNSGCWLWMGSLRYGGYGGIKDRHKKYQAHRWSYEHFVGPIPDGFQIDHLCRVRSCVNPDHLEAVTPRENIRRGDSPTAINARKTHCSRGGHPLFGRNLRLEKNGWRRCRRCERESANAVSQD